MKEEWNEKLIDSLIRTMKEDLQEKNLNFFQKKFLEKQLQELKELKHSSIRKNGTYLDKNRILRKDVYDSYKKIPLWIKEKILKSIFLYEDYEKDAFYQVLPRTTLDTKELLEQSLQYSTWLDYKPFIQFIQKYFLDHQDFLQMTFQNPNYLGETITFWIRNHYYPFIRMNKRNTLDDIATLNHELFHAYYFQHKNEMENTYSWYLSELEGDLSDFLFSLYLQEKHVSSKVIERTRDNYFANGFSHLYSFYLCDLVCQNYEETQKIDLEKIELQTLDSPFACYDNDILKSIMTLEPTQDAKYALAFLINLDLAEIYEKNPQKSMEIVENIRKNVNGNFFQTLSAQHVHFYEDHYARIREYIQNSH